MALHRSRPEVRASNKRPSPSRHYFTVGSLLHPGHGAEPSREGEAALKEFRPKSVKGYTPDKL
jgi:hypothetical protein